jgi:tetratricopeptide (TPR) repeat protein
MIAGIRKNEKFRSTRTGPGPAPVLRLAPEQTRYERDYQYHRTRFLEQLGGLTHGQIKLERIFRPGVDGRPVLDSFAFVFWRARFVLHVPAERRAHELMPELYRSFLRRPLRLLRERGATGVADVPVLAALAHYACWTGRSVWIYNLAALLHEAQLYKNPQVSSFFELASLLAAAESPLGPSQPNARSDSYARLASRSDPYFAYCFQVLRGRVPSGPGALRSASAHAGAAVDSALSGGSDETAISVKPLLWAEAAVRGDLETERYLMRRLTRNPPVDEDDLLDLSRLLAMRGRPARAIRLLLRHNRLCGEKPAVLRVILRAYLINGKYLHYLRRLGQAKSWPGRRTYFEALYCIHRLGVQDREEHLLTRLLAGKKDLQLPADEERNRMRQALTVARSGHPPVMGSERHEWGDLVENHYLLEAAARTRGQPDGTLIRERFRLYRQCVETMLGEGPRETERMHLYFRALLWTFEQYRDQSARPEMEALWPRLRGLAGENLAIRLFFGTMHFERDEAELARRYVESLAGFHPVLLHTRGELALLAGDFERAERIYRRLLDRFPDCATLLYNLGLILERANRVDEARAVFRRVLDVDPRNPEAYDKLQLLS